MSHSPSQLPLSAVGLINELSDLSWPDVKLLALQLQVKPNVLDDIGNDYRGDDRKIQAMQAWLNNEPDASWESVVTALQKMRLGSKADEIASKHCGKVKLPAPSLEASPVGVPVLPALEPVERPSVRKLTTLEVREEIKQLKIKFSSLVTKSRLALSQKESENAEFLEEFRDALLLLPVTDHPLHEKFFQRNADEILAATSINKLFFILSRFWNFTNHALLLNVVDAFCNEGVQLLALSYCNSLDRFEKDTSIDVYVSASNASPEVCQEFVMMAAKLNKTSSQCTLHEVRKLAKSIASRSGVSPYTVYIGSTRVSSVLVEFAVHPAALAPVLAFMTVDFLDDNLLSEVVVSGQPLVVGKSEDDITSDQLVQACGSGNIVNVASLLNGGAMVDSIGTDEFGVFCTALGKATRLGHTDTVTLLLMRNAQPDLKDKNGDTPLKHAATNGHLLIAQILLEHGASMEEVDPESAELLHLYFSDSQPSETTSKDLLLASAAEFEQFKKDEKLAQKLQQQYNKEQHVEAQYPVINEGISEPIEDKNKRLIHACGVGDVDAVAKLINDGADVDCVSQDENKVGVTALHCAISNSHLHTAHILMRHGANLDMQNKDGRTALHYACLRGDLEAVQSLVDHGASVDLHGKDSATPLGEAASMDHTEVVQLLVNHGADIHCTDKDGWTALHWACSGGNLTVTLALLEHGANVNSQAMDSWTPLHLALSVKNTAVVQAILDHQPDIDIQDCNGLTAVMIAAEWGSSLIMKQLIVEHNANLNLQNNLGDTAVIIATLTNGAAVLRCLVEAGADVNIQNEEDLTALMIAAKNGRTDIADILLSGNCDVDIQETVTGWSAVFFAAKDGNTALANLLLKAGANIFLKDRNDVTAVDIASIHSQEVHELLTQHMPKQVTGAQPQPQSLVPSRTERTLGLLNLVNCSGQSITSLFVRLNKRLKSVEKKQRKAMIMKGREQEGHHAYRAHQEEQEGVRDQEKEGDPQKETL